MIRRKKMRNKTLILCSVLVVSLKTTMEKSGYDVWNISVIVIYHLCFWQKTKSAMLLCHICQQELNVTTINNISKTYLGSASVSRFFIFLSCWKWKLISVARTISITRVRNSRNSSLERFWRMLHSSSLITLWTQKYMTMLFVPLIK